MDNRYFQSIRSLTANLKDQIKSVELPEPAMILDMASRGHDQSRQFRYLHQTCTLHAENLCTATQIKVVALLDGYLQNAESHSSIGVYLFSRSLVELSAFTREVMVRLSAVCEKPEDRWRPKGEEFFSILMRARFGTSNQAIAKELKNHGASKKSLEPFNIMKCLSGLGETKEGRVLVAFYDELCDYVHHNLSSHFTSSPGFLVKEEARSAGGGAILSPAGSMPITLYTYPVPNKCQLAIAQTSEKVLACAQLCVAHVNDIPRSPYSAEQVQRVTGSPIGFTQIR